MNTNIVTRFTVATEQGIDALLFLTKTIAVEKFSTILEPQKLEFYIAENFLEQVLIEEVNSRINQWLIVYADNKPVGYARITSKGVRPGSLTGKRAVRIADFGILKEHTDPAIKQSLFDKCWYVCKSNDAAWINEYLENPFISFFESQGFARENITGKMDELPLQSVFLCINFRSSYEL